MSPTARQPHLRLDIDHVLDTKSIVVCCGSGGVGKTTTAAALALRAAERGRRVVVVTIDPARRLAQSLGLTELGNVPRQVAAAGAGGGELHAMMLDMKRTFDEIVVAHADPERAQQILTNPFYISLSSSLAGTQEYMAMEKLGQLHSSGEWDLVVVDTPPTRSALDFLDAPTRLTGFLDGRFIRLMLAPAKAGGRAYMKVVNIGMQTFTGVITRITGAGLLTDLREFFTAFETLFGGFRERAQQTYDLLKADATAFVVVAAPDPAALREASYFIERLSTDSMPLAGVVVNRVHRTGAPQLSAERCLAAAEVLEEKRGSMVAAGVLRLHADRVAIAARERRVITSFTSGLPAVPVAEVEAMSSDVHDLDDLRAIGVELASDQPAA
ncbi:MAG TPA: ArsA-related P-loop ATPase [Mycobacteriales bacterium]|nr:ArsA-related P-loop ATPase [Mycobacteriales bacterium]